MTRTFTNIDVADATIQMFDFMRLAPNGWPLFEKLYGQPFDIMSFTPNDYVYESAKPYTRDEGYRLTLGNGWELKLRLLEGDSASYSRNVPAGTTTLETAFYYDGAWCGKNSLRLNYGKLSATVMDGTFADSVWDRIFEQIKRRAAITLREHKKYLARPVFYDTLESELNIKVRKKK